MHLRALTDADARLHRYGTHAERAVHSHQARLCPSIDADVLKIEPCSILSTSTSDDRRRRASTSVDAVLSKWKAWPNQARLCTRIYGHQRTRHMTDTDGRRRAQCECAFSS